MKIKLDVAGFIPADDMFVKMKSVWDSCLSADIDPPRCVLDYFNKIYPYDEAGTIVDLLGKGATFFKSKERNNIEGFEVKLNRLPERVSVIRFYCTHL